MSVLLEEIRGASQDAAAALEKAGSVSDTDIKMLTRQDLSELIPGAQHFRLRKTIGDIIQNVKPINAVLRERLDFIPDDRVKVILNLLRVLRELLDFIPDDRVKAALTKNGVLNDLMKTKVESVLNGVLNDLMKTKVESVHSFLEALLEAHIGLFEEYAEKREKGRPASSSVDFEPRCAPVERQSHGQGSVADQRTVRVEPIVKGKTFDCHRTLLQHVRKLGGLHVEETASGPKVVVVFCPVSNRYRTDIEAAMKDVVPGGAAVILVVMHHTHDIDYPNIVRSLDGDRCWDFVNVLYHDSVPGLLTCVFNEQAVAQLRGMLLKHSSVVCPVAAAAPSPDAAAAAAAAATAAAPSPFAATHGQAGPASLSVDCAPVKCDSSSQTDDYVQGEMRTILPEPVTNVTLLLPTRPASSSVDFEPRCAPVECQGSVADQPTVRVESIVKGQTFNCHLTLLQRVRKLGGLHVEETTSGPKVVVVFFPVTSCYMKDIEVAMKDVVPGGEAVIVVVMHHTHDINYPNIVRSLGEDRCWDFVNVLYYEASGLLTCTFNEQAVAQLRGMLLKHSSVVSPVAATAAAASVSGIYGKTKGGGGSKPAASPDAAAAPSPFAATAAATRPVAATHGQGSVADQRTVMVKAIVKGKTFDCHQRLLQRVRQLGGLHVEETTSGPQVVVIFCPVTSRHMTDIEAAMKDVVSGGAAVILVVMHHTYDIDYQNIVRSLDGGRGWDFVNVLYHETVSGLLTCAFNEQAVTQLHGMLLKHSSVVSSGYGGGSSGDGGGSSGYGGGSSGDGGGSSGYGGGSSGYGGGSSGYGGGSSGDGRGSSGYGRGSSGYGGGSSGYGGGSSGYGGGSSGYGRGSSGDGGGSSGYGGGSSGYGGGSSGYGGGSSGYGGGSSGDGGGSSGKTNGGGGSKRPSSPVKSKSWLPWN